MRLRAGDETHARAWDKFLILDILRNWIYEGGNENPARSSFVCLWSSNEGALHP